MADRDEFQVQREKQSNTAVQELEKAKMKYNHNVEHAQNLTEQILEKKKIKSDLILSKQDRQYESKNYQEQLER